MMGKGEIREALADPRSGLAITPIVDAEMQIDEGSVDLRLGPDLIVTRRTTGVGLFDPAQVDEIAARIEDYQEYVRRPLTSAFYLHPGEFAIARTLEYVTLPANVGAQVMGRSSLGRLGLIIATATMVQPRFAGTITLELSNLGAVPIVLHVGARIAQIVLFETGAPLHDEAEAE